ncbi:MAG: histidine kinase [Bacteroidota bacterium]
MLGLSRRDLFYNLLVWSAVSLFTATQLHLKSVQANQDSSWVAIFQVQLLVWLLWGFITPLIYWIAHRFRINRQNFFIRLFIHLPISIGIVLIYLSAYSVIWNLNQYGSMDWSSFRGIGTVLFLNLFHWHFFIYIAIIGVVHANIYLSSSKEQEVRNALLEKELLTSKLNFLKMQLQPHFLFNTLNGIVSSIHQKKTDTAASMTTELSELLRTSLSENDQQITSLEKELRYVKMYLNIEKHRFKQLKVHYQIPDSLLKVEVPNFFLQPLVENAIKHGISKQSKAERIEISAEKINDSLLFSIYNDGPPITKYAEGVGLSNLRKRLRAIYESLGKFNIYAHGSGTKVEVSLPI